MLLGTLRELGLEGVRAGIADGPFTAEQAARIGATAGGAGVPRALRAARRASSRRFRSRRWTIPELAGLLARLGVQTLGEFAAMEAGPRAREVRRTRHPSARPRPRGATRAPSSPRVPPPELHREVAFEPPLEIAEQVAFGMRLAADEFIAGLGAVDLVCTELRVELIGDRGERSERVWLHPGSFDAAAVVDRVRWQLSEAEDARGASVL